jgi:hypothetical protein
MDHLSAQLAIRDRYRRRLALLKMPEQRMVDMARRRKAMWARLQSNPEDYAHFLRRNYKARAIPTPNLDHSISD